MQPIDTATATHYLKVFREVTRLITSTLDINEVLSIISRKVPDVIDADAATIRLLDLEEKRLILLAAHGLSEAYLNRGPLDMEASVVEALGGTPVAVTDATTDERISYSEEAKKEGIRSILVAPIPIKGNVQGVLRLLSRKPRTFSDAEIDFVTSIAEQCGIAIENARTYEGQLRQLQYFKTLHQIGQTLNSAVDLEDVLKVIVDKLPPAMDLKGCTLRLLDPSKGHLELLAASGLSRAYLERGSIDDELSTHHALQGQPMAITDATKDLRNRYRQEAQMEGIASLLAVPLVYQKQTIGVLRLLTAAPRRFSEADINFAMAVAEQAGTAIHNAIGFGKIHDLVAELQQQEAFLQQVIDHLHADIFVLDTAYRFVMVNRVFLENHGQEGSEILGKSCFSVLRAGSAEAPIRQVVKQNRPVVFTRHEKTNGETVHLEVTVSPVMLEENGEQADLLIGAIRDVTDHVRLQDAQRSRERLRGVLEMAGAAAHELNTPVFVALGAAKLLAAELEAVGTHQEGLQSMIRNLEAVSELTRKMTRITRYESKDYVGGRLIVDIDKACEREW